MIASKKADLGLASVVQSRTNMDGASAAQTVRHMDEKNKQRRHGNLEKNSMYIYMPESLEISSNKKKYKKSFNK